MPDTEAAYRVILGRNISADRGRLQLSQTAVAARMQELGFEDWRQQTVANVEKGKRRVTAEEVLGLVLALDSTLPRLLAPIGGDLWIELPSDSGHVLPSMDVIGLANGAQGGAGTVSWYKNSLVRSVLPPGEVEAAEAQFRLEDLASRPIPVEEGKDRPVVAAIVTSGLGMLISHRRKGKVRWGFITGEIEPDESPKDAAWREVKEETGLEVVTGRVIGERNPHPMTGKHMIYMAAVPAEGTDVFVGDETELDAVRWVRLAEADKLMPTMYEPVREHLARELGGAGEG